MILAVLAKGLLYSVPVSDDFGLVSLLSGAKEDCLRLLHGAGLSGNLRDDVHVRFEVSNEAENTTIGKSRVQVLLEKSDRSNASNIYGALKRKTVYS